MSDAPALRHAAIASSSSAGRALTGPGGSISFAAGTDLTVVDVDDFPDSEVEASRPAVLDGPEVHPTKTRETATRMAPMLKERDVLSHGEIMRRTPDRGGAAHHPRRPFGAVLSLGAYIGMPPVTFGVRPLSSSSKVISF
jgi:hypothetical protein